MELVLKPDGTADRSQQILHAVEAVGCPVCATERLREMTRAKAHYSEDVFVVQECLTCGLIFVSPRLNAAFRSFCYKRETHLVDWFRKTEDAARRDAEHALAVLADIGVARGRLLEVGSGLGTFLEVASDRGFEVLGIELNEALARHASERSEVAEGDFLDSSLDDGAYDVVVLDQTLEHLSNPLEALARVRDALRVGGLAYITVPKVDWLVLAAARLLDDRSPFGRLWSPEDHLYYFRPRSMERLVRAAGLEPVSRMPGTRLSRLGTKLGLSSGVFIAAKPVGDCSAVGSGARGGVG